MTEEECMKGSLLIYEEFYRQVTLNQSYVFTNKKNKQTKTLLKKFIDWVNNQFSTKSMKNGLLRVDYEWLVGYFKFQFNYWIWKIDSGKEYYKYGYNGIQLNWVLGEEAKKRFIKQNENFIKCRRINLINKAEVSVLNKLKRLSNSNTKAFLEVFVNDSKIEERELYYNTNEGLINCLINTTLFNPKLKICLECNNRTICKEALKENYPEIYKIRMNGI